MRDGEVRHAARVHYLSGGGRRGFQQGRRGGDRHGLGHRAHFHGEVHLDAVVDAQFDVLTHGALETGRLDGDGVTAQRQIRRLVYPLFISFQRGGDAGGHVSDLNGGAGDGGILRVGHAAPDGTAGLLGPHRGRAKQHNGEQMK